MLAIALMVKVNLLGLIEFVLEASGEARDTGLRRAISGAELSKV